MKVVHQGIECKVIFCQFFYPCLYVLNKTLAQQGVVGSLVVDVAPLVELRISEEIRVALQARTHEAQVGVRGEPVSPNRWKTRRKLECYTERGEPRNKE